MDETLNTHAYIYSHNELSDKGKVIMKYLPKALDFLSLLSEINFTVTRCSQQDTIITH